MILQPCNSDGGTGGILRSSPFQTSESPGRISPCDISPIFSKFVRVLPLAWYRTTYKIDVKSKYNEPIKRLNKVNFHGIKYLKQCVYINCPAVQWWMLMCHNVENVRCKVYFHLLELCMSEVNYTITKGTFSSERCVYVNSTYWYPSSSFNWNPRVPYCLTAIYMSDT